MRTRPTDPYLRRAGPTRWQQRTPSRSSRAEARRRPTTARGNGSIDGAPAALATLAECDRRDRVGPIPLLDPPERRAHGCECNWVFTERILGEKLVDQRRYDSECFVDLAVKRLAWTIASTLRTRNETAASLQAGGPQCAGSPGSAACSWSAAMTRCKRCGREQPGGPVRVVWRDAIRLCQQHLVRLRHRTE